mgnify:FL=1
MIDFERKDHYGLSDLLRIVALLRSEDGCPWDRVQTHASLRRSLLEEAYEAAEAIDREDPALLKEELGDLLLQVVFHAVAKNILFLCAGAIIYKTHKTYVSELKGIGKEMPIVMWTFALAALSLIGIPPTSGFVSKWYLAQGGLLPQAGMLGLVGVAVLMVSALLTAGYLMSIVVNGFFPGKDFDYASLQKKEPNYLMTVPLVLLSIAVVGFGMMPAPLMQAIRSISGMIF